MRVQARRLDPVIDISRSPGRGGVKVLFVPLSITVLDAFRAAGVYIARFAKESPDSHDSEGLTTLLGYLQVDPERGVLDPTAWFDWLESLRAVLDDVRHLRVVTEPLEPDARYAALVSRIHGFLAMRSFIDHFHTRAGNFGSSWQLESLLGELALGDLGLPLHSGAWEDWVFHIRITAGHPLVWRRDR